MRKLFKNEIGITLVALVVTIIILLILAGISIATLTGSGLFEKARLAEQKSKNEQEKEEVILTDYENKISEYVNGTRNDYSNKRNKLNSVKGTTNITLPDKFSEIKIVSEYPGQRTYTVNIIYDELTNENKIYSSGMYAGNAGAYYISWIVSQKNIQLVTFYEYGSDVTNDVTTTIYYK